MQWTDYLRWYRLRDGFRTWLASRLPKDAREPKINRYLRGDGDLTIDEIQRLLELVPPQTVVRDTKPLPTPPIQPALHDQIPVDLFRAGWLEQKSFTKLCSSSENGSSITPTSHKPHLYGFVEELSTRQSDLVIDGDAFLVLVLNGDVVMSCLRTTETDVKSLLNRPTEAVRIKQGEILLFDGAVPHRFASVNGPAKILRLLCRSGRPGHQGRTKYDAKIVLKNLSAHALHGVHFTVALRTTIALHRVYGSMQPPERYRRLKKGWSFLSEQHRVREIARHLHFSERYFWDMGETKAYRKVDTKKLTPTRHTHDSHAAAHDQGVYRPAEIISCWRDLGRVGPGPLVGLFEVTPHKNWLQDFPPEDHHAQRPGAALMYVLRGQMCFSGHPIGIQENIIEGTLHQGDAISFTSQIAHTFGNDKTTPARLLHVRWPFPPHENLY